MILGYISMGMQIITEAWHIDWVECTRNLFLGNRELMLIQWPLLNQLKNNNNNK